jgi:glutamate-1-semialdehyde 2,1-aminomutase
LTPEAFDRLAALGERLRTGIAAGIASTGLGASITGIASLFQVGAGDSVVSATATGAATAPDLFLGLLLEGFYVAPRGMGAIPLVATGSDVDELAAAVCRVLADRGQTVKSAMPSDAAPAARETAPA